MWHAVYHVHMTTLNQDAPVYCSGFVTGSWSLTSAIVLPCVLLHLLALRSYLGLFYSIGRILYMGKTSWTWQLYQQGMGCISHQKPKTHKQTQQVLAMMYNSGARETAMHNANTERSVTANNGPQSSKHNPTKQQTKAPEGVRKKKLHSRCPELP